MHDAPRSAPRQGTALLLALALTVIAGMIAYGFAFSMRQAGTAAKGMVVTALADSAARMGAQQAYEVVLGEYAADPTGVTSPVGRHFTDFADHDHFNPSWINPNPGWDQSNSAYELDGDDINSEAKLYYSHHAWFGGQGQGQTYRSEGNSWPNDGRQTSMLSIGMGRYIEPGYHNKDGTAKPVRFSTVPGSAPDFNRPVWYDENFRPAASRAEARYRLRYAVNVMDLGGHLIYGSQSPFAAATAPTEWNTALGQEYRQSIYNLLSGQNMNDSGTNPARPQMMTMFLGYGTSVAHGDYWTRYSPGQFLAGFTGAGAPLPFESIPGMISPAVPMAGRLTSGSTGGPISWSHAQDSHDAVGAAGGWATRWVYSPYGRATEYKAGAAKYYESDRTNCPWRINTLTAPVMTVRTMLYAYLPPEITKPVATAVRRYSWIGFTNPPWPNLSSPKWSTTARPAPDSRPLIPREPGAAFGPGLHLHNTDFSPSYLAGVRPFNGFSSANYAVPTTATTFDACYPAPARFWENYAAYPAAPLPGARDGDNRTLLRQCMLGTDIDIFDTHGNYWSNEWGALSGRIEWTIAPGVRAGFGGASRVGGTGEPREPIRGMCGPSLFTYQWGGSQENINGDRVEFDLDTGQGFYHRDSYWLDIAAATAGVTVLAKSLYFDTASCGASPARMATDMAPARPVNVADLDRLFLAILGEYYPGDASTPGSTATPKAGHIAVREWPGDDWNRPGSRVAIVDNTSSANIRTVKSKLTADGLPNIDEKCANMERVLNDWRMSFFGANRTYTNFRPLDFDGDGKAVASCYASTVTVGAETFPGSAATGGVGAAPDYYWSLTGYFVMERGRFWRVLTRGEVFDERLKKPIAESNFESVFTIDPDGDFTGLAGSLGDSCTLYQRWITNYYRGLQPMSQ